MTNHDKEAPSEQNSTIRHFHPRKIHGNVLPSGRPEHKVTVTDAIDFMGLSEKEASNTTFRIDPQDVSGDVGERMVPCVAFTGDGQPNGRTSDLYRALQVTGVGDSPAYRIVVPDEVLDALGYPKGDNRGRLIDVYAGEGGILAFAEVESREIEAEPDLDIIKDILPPKAQEHYRKVVVEGKTIEEVGQEIEEQEDLDDRSWPAKYQVERNVEKAKEIIGSING